MLVIPALDGSCWLSFYSLRWDHCDSFYRIAHLFMAQLDESLRKSINSHLRISCSTGPPLVCTNCHEKLFLHPFDHFLWRFMELKSSQCDLPFAQTSRWSDPRLPRQDRQEIWVCRPSNHKGIHFSASQIVPHIPRPSTLMSTWGILPTMTNTLKTVNHEPPFFSLIRSKGKCRFFSNWPITLNECRPFQSCAGANRKARRSPLQHSIWTALARGSDRVPSDRYLMKSKLKDMKRTQTEV